MNNIYLYILTMALVTYLIRALPLTLIRRHITNTFIRSCLYYMPFVALSVMTFPAIITATDSPLSASIGFVVALVMAWFGKSLITVATLASATVFVLELFL